MPITRPLSLLNPDRYNLGNLTSSEVLWIWRHRQISEDGRIMGRCGRAMSQKAAAAKLGISKRAYIRLETGSTTRLSMEDLQDMNRILQTLSPLNPRLSVSELCLLARRRSGMSLQEVAGDGLGLSRVRYLDLERHGDGRVLQHWENNGFRFPQTAAVAA